MEERDFKSLVLERAKDMFKKYGYKKTTVDDIAKACHKSKGLIYHYYNSKEEIFRIIVNDELSQSIFVLKKNLKDDISVKEKFYSFISIFYSMFNDYANLYYKIFIDLFDYIDILKEDIEKFYSEVMEIIKDILKEGIAKDIFLLDNLESTAISIVHITVGFIFSPLRQKLNLNIEMKIDINNFSDMIYYGLEKR